MTMPTTASADLLHAARSVNTLSLGVGQSLRPKKGEKRMDLREIQRNLKNMPDYQLRLNISEGEQAYQDGVFQLYLEEAKKRNIDIEDNHDKKNNSGNTIPRLVICNSCNSNFSERAKNCPKCGAVQTKECQVCNKLIPTASSHCPECGDPSPFLIQDNNQEYHETNSFQNQIVHETKEKAVIKRILITAPFVLFIMLIVGVVKDLMQPGLLRGVIIVLCFLSIFRFWIWISKLILGGKML